MYDHVLFFLRSAAFFFLAAVAFAILSFQGFPRNFSISAES